LERERRRVEEGDLGLVMVGEEVMEMEISLCSLMVVLVVGVFCGVDVSARKPIKCDDIVVPIAGRASRFLCIADRKRISIGFWVRVLCDEGVLE
jgi:hypothetical protein